MPPEDCTIDTTLKQLLDETEDFINSQDFAIVRSTCMDRLFKTFLDGIEPAFKSPPKRPESPSNFHPRLQNSIEEIDERTTRLVNLLPQVTKESRLILEGMPNTYAETLTDIPELLEYSAVIFSSYDPEMVL